MARAKFHPLYGFNNLEDHMINNKKSATAIACGKIVDYDENDALSLANDYGYFLMQEITTDGPSLLEMELGDWQWEVKVGTRVSILKPAKGAVVRTEHVAKATDGAAPAVGQKLNIANGVYVTVASNAGTKGVIKKVVTDSLGNVLYDVEIL